MSKDRIARVIELARMLGSTGNIQIQRPLRRAAHAQAVSVRLRKDVGGRWVANHN